MKASKLVVLMIGLIAFMSSCQKEDMPGPNSNCPSHQQDNGGNLRVTDDNGTDNPSGGSMSDGTGVTQDTVIIVGGGDDDRDGGGIVGGGDGDRDGGRLMQDRKKNK